MELVHYPIKTIVKSLFLISFSIFVISCSGSDDSISQESIDRDGQISGFQGLSSVQTISASQLSLQWEASTNSEVVSYNIYDVRLPSSPVLIKTVPASSSSTIISALREGFLYRYRVRAISSDGKEDGNENDMPGIPYTGIVRSTVISSTAVQISITPVPQTEALSGNVYCNTPQEPDWQVFATVSDMGATSVTLNGLTQNVPYTCRYNVSVDGEEDNNLGRVTFTALGRATRISFLQSEGGVQPGNGQSGELLIIQPQVVILDENDNIVAGGPDSSALISLTVSVASPTGGTIRGTAAVNAVEGVAAFTDLFMQESGAKIISATKSDTSGLAFGSPTMTTDSEEFNILAGTNISPTLSEITISPGPSPPLVANGSDSYQVLFTLRDDFGNPVSGVIPNFSSNILGDFLSQPTTPTDALGQTSGSLAATVADTNSAAITRVLNISSPSGLESLTVEAPFSPGPASKLAFTTQPQNSAAGAEGLNDNISVSVQDSFNNVITSGSAANSSITVTINNNVNGANLTGTTTVNAVNGVAVFSDLGIDQTGNGYRLAANSGSLQPSFSNGFNISSGIPRVIAMEGPTDVISGGCSDAVSLELRDFGGNAATAVQNTIVQISGLGDAQIYSNTSCSGSPLSENITFTPGTSTRVLYLSSDKVESLNIVGADTSGVLTPSAYNILVTPSRLRLIAEAAPPAAPGSPLEVPSNVCSTAMSIVPLAEDGSQGQVFTSTSVALTGFVGSEAKVYSDASCTTEVDVNDVSLNIAAPPNESTLLYVRGPISESLLVNVTDLNGLIATVSPQQTVNILSSEVDFTGPASVVSGACSQAFNITLEDSQGNPTVTSADITFTVNGLDAYTSGGFYTTSNCTGPNSDSEIVFPSGNSSMVVYFRGIASAQLSIFLSDDRDFLNDSPAVDIVVSPSDLEFLAPGAGSSNVAVCAGPFTARTVDGNSDPSNVLMDTTVNLSGGGDAGLFFTDSSCENVTGNVIIAEGTNSTDFYFVGYYPEASLNLNMTDNAGVLTPANTNWSITPELSFLGSVTNFGPNPKAMPPFRKNFTALQSSTDGITGAWHLDFDPTYRYLYVVDRTRNKVLKYDYVNEEYVGWIGRASGRATPTSSNISDPSPAACANVSSNTTLPGWCVGGKAISGLQTSGGLTEPRGITVDDTYVYVVSHGTDTISRYLAETGEFAGWIGVINSTSGIIDANDDGSTANDLCPTASQSDPTPVWCMGGSSRGGVNNGDGNIHDPTPIAHDSTYLYVGQGGAVLRFNKTTGTFSGWIGRVRTISPTSNALGTIGNCTATGPDTQTPGWCIGGDFEGGDPVGSGNMNGADDIFVTATDLYVINFYGNRVINRYNITTGAFIETLPDHNLGWGNGRSQITWDPDQSRFLIATSSRILKVTTSGLIEGWIGKVRSNSNLSGPGCGTLSINDNTPGWCIGGTHKGGLDEGAFISNNGIAYDGNGHFVTASTYVPKIQKIDAVTGSYVGSWGVEDVSPSRWLADFSKVTQGRGFSDEAGHEPRGVLAVGDYLFVTDVLGSRVKKLNRKTGEVIGWVGAITTVPTGGQDGTGCTSANAMGPSPGWCLGAEMYPSNYWNTFGMISEFTQGIMQNPFGLASDGTWLFVTDAELHRVHRYRVDDGSYGGWLGRISTVSPTGGSGSNCIAANNANHNSFTGGWCFGGRSREGKGDGELNEPQGITFANGNIYVVDFRNHRVSSYNATTGQFNGWIGRVNQSPTSGCSPASNGNYPVSNTGWCIGGESSIANDGTDRGGAFYFRTIADIFSDGTHLYITNSENSRIDRFNFNGEFVDASAARTDEYNNSWQSDPADVGTIGSRDCGDPMSVWVDSDYVYGLNISACYRNNSPMILWKMDKATGVMVGWKGGVGTVAPSGGEAGCLGATGYTPAWCQGGRVTNYDRLGGFEGNAGYISGDEEFIYVTDRVGNRVIRVPK